MKESTILMTIWKKMLTLTYRQTFKIEVQNNRLRAIY